MNKFLLLVAAISFFGNVKAQTKQTIDNKFSAGIYFVKATANGNQSVMKFIVE